MVSFAFRRRFRCPIYCQKWNFKQRHILSREACVRDLVDRYLIDLYHVNSKQKTADGFTKKLNGDSFKNFFYALGFIDE